MYFELRLPQYTWLPSDKRPLVYEAQSCCQVMGLSGSWWWHSGTGVAIGTKGTVAKRCHQQVRVVGRRHGGREGRGAYQGEPRTKGFLSQWAHTGNKCVSCLADTTILCITICTHRRRYIHPQYALLLCCRSNCGPQCNI